MGDGVLVRLDCVVLRPAVDADRQRWFEALTDPVQRAFGAPAFVPAPASVDDVDARIAASRAAAEAVTPGVLVLADADDDRFLGDVGWRYDVPAPMRIADVGYQVHPAERGRGVATTGLRLLVAWLTDDAGGPQAARVQLDHSVENVASCRVALAAGLEREGVRRRFLPLADPSAPSGVRRHDVCLHGLAVE